jgi:hypothetical protein
MVVTYNGMLAAELGDVRWMKSQHSNPNGACVEVAALPNGEIAMRNSRFPAGAVLLYTQAEITAFLAGAKDGEFDHLLARTASLPTSNINPADTRRRSSNRQPNQNPTTCDNTERFLLLLICHTTPFRKRETPWETGPHPARILDGDNARSADGLI